MSLKLPPGVRKAHKAAAYLQRKPDFSFEVL